MGRGVLFFFLRERIGCDLDGVDGEVGGIERVPFTESFLDGCV